MSPIRAQGINMALRDAIVAANHLVPALREGRPQHMVCLGIPVVESHGLLGSLLSS